MNKTNEAFEAWWADTGEQSLFALGTTTDEDIKTIAGIAWEAAIREALAETEITTPDVCGEVCARAKLCYGCNKAFDEANKKLNNDHAWLSKDELTQYWKGYGDGKREALANHIPDATKMVAEHKCGGCAKTAADGWALYCVECWEKVEPVKQEPVGYWNGKETAWFEHELCGHPAPDDCTIPLYAAPVDAKAVRAEALEKAAELGDSLDPLQDGAIGRAIRGLK